MRAIDHIIQKLYIIYYPFSSDLIQKGLKKIQTVFSVWILEGTTSFHGITVHGMSIHGMSLHGLVHGNDPFSPCSWNDMVHGMLHSLPTFLELACLSWATWWLMTSRASFWLTELRGKGTKQGEGKGSKLGKPCPKVRLSRDRLPIEPLPAWKVSWGEKALS
jgi:hypothetical protein